MPIDLRSSQPGKKESASLPVGKIVGTTNKNLTEDKKKNLEKKFAEMADQPTEETKVNIADEQVMQVLDPGIKALMKLQKEGKNVIKQDEPKPEPESVEEKPVSAGGAELPTNCQHCGWKLNVPENEPSREDRLSFLASVLGQTRWRKEYTFMDGGAAVIFRTLTTEEADLAFTQTAFDAQSGKILDEDRYFRTLMDYRLAMSLEKLRLKDKTILVPEIGSSEYKTDTPPKGATKLIYVLPWIYDNVLSTEQLRRIAGSNLFRFQRLVEQLEARVDDQDFWKATGAQS